MAARPSSSLRAVPLALAIALAPACASGPKPVAAPVHDSRFPSQDELAKLPPPPAAAQLALTHADQIDAWTLAGPFPERVDVAPHAPANPYEALLEQAVAGRAGLAVGSEAMHCTAREVGRFLLARRKPPPLPLLEFIAARCGAVGAEFQQAWYHGDVPSSLSDAALFEQWRPQLEQLVQRSLGGGSVAAGVWFGRDGGRAVFATVSTLRRVLVTPFSPVAAAGQLDFSGEVLVRIEDVTAWVNQGRLGYAECTRDPSVPLPRFALSCPLAPGDRSALIEVSLREPGRVLGLAGLRVLARRPGEEAASWQRQHSLAPQPVATPQEFAEAVAGVLGRVRASAELHPLGLSLPQSQQANALVPFVFAGTTGAGSPALADLAALGLAAGWQVGGVVKNAALTSGATTETLDASRWLEAALERPSGRSALLDPDARVLAVGALASQDPPAAAALAVTYQLFGEEDLRAEAERVVERVGAARKARGRSAPTRLSSATPVVEQVAQELPDRNIDPLEALEDALARATAASAQPLRGWVLEASQLDAATLPPDLLDAETLRLAVAVGYYQPEEEPWGRYVVLILANAPDVGI
jgi:hypothetical protein